MNQIPKWHFAMLNDHARNDSFAAAIRATVENGDTVVDIGSGTGLLTILAAQAGAETVDAFEANEQMAAIAEVVIPSNISSRVVLHRTLSTNVQFRESDRKNVLVTEIFDCAVIGEGIIPALRHARENLLKPGYKAVPERVRLFGALVSSDDIRDLNEVSTAAGVDVAPLNSLQTHGHFPVRLTTWEHTLLSGPQPLFTLTLTEEPPPNGSHTTIFTATESGRIDGVVCWFEMDLGAGQVISTAPHVRSHWMQAFIPLPQPTQVTKGDEVLLSYTHTETKFVARSLKLLNRSVPQTAPARITSNT